MEVHYYTIKSELSPGLDEGGRTPCGLPSKSVSTTDLEKNVTCDLCARYLLSTTPWMRGEIDDTPGLDT